MSCCMQLQVRPGARKNNLLSIPGGWKVQVAAPPVDGKANEALCAFLAREVLEVPERQLRIRSGASGRNKLIEFDLPIEQVQAAFMAWVQKNAS